PAPIAQGVPTYLPHKRSRCLAHPLAFSLQHVDMAVERAQRAVGQHRDVAVEDRQRLAELVQHLQDQSLPSLYVDSVQSEDEQRKSPGRNELQAVLDQLEA